MNNLYLREPMPEDKNQFILAMQLSQHLHHPWTSPPQNDESFEKYIQSSKQKNQKCYLLCDQENNIMGVFNISEIVLGSFQSAYLGFYAVATFAGHGYMSKGLKLVLKEIFEVLKLHRIEANIQPENKSSINLIKANNFCKEGFSPRYLKINNEWRDHERWALTYEDWSQQKP